MLIVNLVVKKLSNFVDIQIQTLSLSMKNSMVHRTIRNQLMGCSCAVIKLDKAPLNCPTSKLVLHEVSSFILVRRKASFRFQVVLYKNILNGIRYALLINKSLI